MASKEEIEALIKAKGDEIRQLKAEKSEKDTILAQVALLNVSSMRARIISHMLCHILASVIMYTVSRYHIIMCCISFQKKVLSNGIFVPSERPIQEPCSSLFFLETPLQELKAKYKETTGEDFGPPPSSSKKKGEAKKTDGAPASGLKVDPRKAAKEARAAKRAAGGVDQATSTASNSGGNATDAATSNSGSAPSVPSLESAKYGNLPMVQSLGMTDRVWGRIDGLSPSRAGQRVLLRGRLHTSRAVGKGVFLLLRQGIATVQAVVYQGPGVDKGMVKFAGAVPRESVIDLVGTLTAPREPVESATARLVEVQVDELYVVSAAENVLPFQLEDASRPEASEDPEMPSVGMDNRLNYRWIDTRTAANQAIFRIQHGVSQLFREFLCERGFVEIHTPKLLGGASESGSSVFTLTYFDQSGCLAQSPQLYKQMACACGGFEKVFEVGPVFRAEKSFTHRHLCEFTGLDLEMAIHEHYYEVLELFSDLFIYIFDNLATRFAAELQAVNKQHPFEPLQFCRPSLRLSFAEGVALLREAGYDASEMEDLDTEKEKALGRIVKEKYKTDFYMMDRYPLSVRPFYTMPCPDDPTLSNSFDMFIRGEEIVSGAQRIHDVELLGERIDAMGVPRETLRTYMDAFRHGALPHGGGGIGLERVVMLYLGLKNIRKTSLFPRDPKRLAP